MVFHSFSYTGKWVKIDTSAIPHNTYGDKYLFKINDFNYLLVCNEDNLIMIFNALDNNWETLSYKNNNGKCLGTPVYYDNNLFFFGGNSMVNEDSTFMKFDITGMKWDEITLDTMPEKRYEHNFINIDGNNLLLSGGLTRIKNNGDGFFYWYLYDNWYYHLKTNKWEKNVSLKNITNNGGYIIKVSDEKVFLFGGFTQDSDNYKFGQRCCIVDIKTGFTDTIIPKADVPKLMGPSVTLIDSNKILVFGGRKFYSYDSLEYTNETWIIDLEKRKMEKVVTDVMPSPRSGAAIASNGMGVAYLYGGNFNINTDTWKFVLDGPNTAAEYDSKIQLDLKLLYSDNGLLTVNLNEPDGQNAEFRLYKPNGSLVRRLLFEASGRTALQTDVTDLVNGVYLVVVTSNNRVHTGKFIKLD